MVVPSSTKKRAPPGPSDESDSDARQQEKKWLWNAPAYAFPRLLHLELEGAHL